MGRFDKLVKKDDAAKGADKVQQTQDAQQKKAAGAQL